MIFLSNKNKKENKTADNAPVMCEDWERRQILNKYGTYNIQPTADTENEFPHISQGIPKRSIK